MNRLTRFVPVLSFAFAAGLPAQDQPPTGKPATGKPAAEKPAAEKPAAEKPAADKASKDKVDFAAQVWPILEKNCIECHATPHVGEDGKKTKPKGNIVLDSKDGITTSKKGKLIAAKKPDDSLLYDAITRAPDAKKRMPPAKKADPLTKEQTDLIKKWIEQGASFGTWEGTKEEKTEGQKPEAKKKEGDAAGKPRRDKGKGGDGR